MKFTKLRHSIFYKWYPNCIKLINKWYQNCGKLNRRWSSLLVVNSYKLYKHIILIGWLLQSEATKRKFVEIRWFPVQWSQITICLQEEITFILNLLILVCDMWASYWYCLNVIVSIPKLEPWLNGSRCNSKPHGHGSLVIGIVLVKMTSWMMKHIFILNVLQLILIWCIM